MELVLAITSHGELLPDSLGYATEFTVPAGMKITRVNFMPVGSCSMVSPDTNDVIVKRLISIYAREDLTLEQKLEATKKNMVELRNLTVNFLRRNPNPGELTKEFLTHSHLPIETKTYEAGTPILEKVYSRFMDEVYADKSKYNYRINAISLPDVPNLFDIYEPERVNEFDGRKIEFLMLSKLLPALQSAGFNHIILIDFTCAGVYSATQRGNRMARRNATQEGQNGGKRTRRPKRKTKTRKGKKRTTQWKH